MGIQADILKECELHHSMSRLQLDLADNIYEEPIYLSSDYIMANNSHKNELYLILLGKFEDLISPNPIMSQSDSFPHHSVVKHEAFAEMG